MSRFRERGAVAAVSFAAALLIGVSGCSATNPESTGEGPGKTTGAATPSETTETLPEDTSERWPISMEGIGPFTVGMRYADALTTPGADVSESCTGVAEATPSGDQWPGAVSLWAVASQQDPASTITEITVSIPADAASEHAGDPPLTEEGVGLGATVDDVTEAYPDARELDDTGIPGRNLYYVQGDNAGMIFTVEPERGLVWGISVTAGDLPSYEPCA